MVENTPNKPSTNNDKTHARIDEVKDKVDAATDRAEARARDTTAAGARGAHRAADQAADWRQRGGDAVDNARKQVEGLFDSARTFVHEKPVESAAMALVAGWLVGRLMSRHH